MFSWDFTFECPKLKGENWRKETRSLCFWKWTLFTRERIYECFFRKKKSWERFESLKEKKLFWETNKVLDESWCVLFFSLFRDVLFSSLFQEDSIFFSALRVFISLPFQKYSINLSIQNCPIWKAVCNKHPCQIQEKSCNMLKTYMLLSFF